MSLRQPKMIRAFSAWKLQPFLPWGVAPGFRISRLWRCVASFHTVSVAVGMPAVHNPAEWKQMIIVKSVAAVG